MLIFRIDLTLIDRGSETYNLVGGHPTLPPFWVKNNKTIFPILCEDILDGFEPMSPPKKPTFENYTENLAEN